MVKKLLNCFNNSSIHACLSKSRKKLAVLAMASFFSSCAHRGDEEIIADPALAPIEAGQGRVETEVCGHYAVGDNICWISPNLSADDVKVKVFTYFDGIVRIKSERCQIDVIKNYEDSQPVEITLSDFTAERPPACILDILLQPSFPQTDEARVENYGMSGRVILASLAGDELPALIAGPSLGSGLEFDDPFYGGAALISLPNNLKSETYAMAISTGESESGIFYLNGCGLGVLEDVYTDSQILLQVNQFAANQRKLHCVLFGIARPDEVAIAASFPFLVAAEIYDANLVPLAEPVLKLNGKRLTFATNDPVSWTFVNGELIHSGSGSTKVDRADDIIKVVQLTSAGRSRVVKFFDNKIIWSK